MKTSCLRTSSNERNNGKTQVVDFFLVCNMSCHVCIKLLCQHEKQIVCVRKII